MAAHRFIVRLSEPLRGALERLSGATGRTASDLAREAIEQYLLRHANGMTCYELAEKTGLIGCVDTGRRELSTNPQHMNSFGR